MLYDIHSHAFIPKIAERILAQLENHYGIPPVGNGLMEDLLEREKRAGVEMTVVHNAATSPKQVQMVNNWAISLQRDYADRVIAFGSLHPALENWPQELERLKQAGIKGLKLHPEFQGFWMNDPGLKDIMEAAWKDFVFLFHVGDRLPPEQNPSCPYKMAAILEEFPQAKIIAAHLGGYQHWEAVREVLAGKKVYLDTSSSLSFISEEILLDIFKRHPREYLLFGSDYPLFDPLDECILLKKRLGLSRSEIELLMSNADRLFRP